MPPSSLVEREVEVPSLNTDSMVCKLQLECIPVAPEDEVAMATPVVSVMAPPARRVHFQDADVIEFEPTLWTSTVSSDGAPVGLSNKVRRRTRRRLDSWEEDRALTRVVREEYMEHGYLEPEERLDILEAAGHAMATVHHVEHDTIRINRERWESNEHDLRYQYGLGEVVDLDHEYDDEQGNVMLQSYGYADDDRDDAIDFDDEDEDMLEDDDNESLHSYYYGQSNVMGLGEEEDMRIAMDAIDSYDSRRFDEWAWDYATDAMLSETEEPDADDETPVPYPEELFGLHDLVSSETDLDVDRQLAEMSTSPSDISAASECGGLAACVSRFEPTKPVSASPEASATSTITTSMSAPYAIV